MTTETTRRNFLRTLSLGTAVAILPDFVMGKSLTDTDVELIDYHVHLSGSFNIEKAVAIFKEQNMKFGVVAHPVRGNIRDDQSLLNYFESLKPYDVFIGLQPADPGWYNHFLTRL